MDKTVLICGVNQTDDFVDPELAACTPVPLKPDAFNPNAIIPCGVTVDHVRLAMESFLKFLGFMNTQMHTQGIERLETMLMSANFSSIVGEFMTSNIPKFCPTIVKNQYHNGHPDMLPKGVYDGDQGQHVEQGIEVKGSRYLRGWQGHNPEDTWLMVFVFASNSATDASKGIAAAPFRFVKVVGAELVKADWNFSGRTGESRRTITASINSSGFRKMEENWIYRAPVDMSTPAAATLFQPEVPEDADDT